MLTSFAAVQAFIAQVLTTNGQSGGASFAPHRAFWATLSYQEFVFGNVPNVTAPGTGLPIPILVKGNSAASALVMSLRGVGPLFDPKTGAFGQMPANGPPMFTAAQVDEIAGWIDAGCPE